jgi:acyl-coenzyme A thioesterase PaaI-like protein
VASSSERLDLRPHAVPFIYPYVNARTMALSEDEATGTLIVRDDLRVGRGPSAAALAVVLQDLSAVTIARFAPLVVPIQINVRIRRAAGAARELVVAGSTLRRGRAVMATEARMADVDDPTTTVAWATGSWATMGSNLSVPKPGGPGPGSYGDGRPKGVGSCLEAIGATLRADGRGWELAEVAPAHREPIALGGEATGTLHAGALQVLAEGAAATVAGRYAAVEELMVEELSTQFLAPVRSMPVAAVGEAISVRDDGIDIRVEVREEGGSGRLAALSFVRFAPPGGLSGPPRAV